MSVTKPLGYLDIGQLIKDSKGLVESVIFDSGAYRVGKGKYDVEDLGEGNYKISVAGSKRNNPHIIVSQKIPITYQTIAFIGLYIGDGAKASSGRGSGRISFSQRETNLTNFVRSQFVNIFGPTISFTHRVNEDALYFLTNEGREKMSELRKKMRSGGQQIPEESEILFSLQQELADIESQLPSSTKRALDNYRAKPNLWRRHRNHLVEFFMTRKYMAEFLRLQKLMEFETLGITIGDQDKISVNIRLPGVKGSREEGKSSRSDELDVNGLAPFRPILLRILSDVEDSILKNKKEVIVKGARDPWIKWNVTPQSGGHLVIDNAAYIENASSVQYVTPSGRVNRLVIQEVNDKKITLSKPRSRIHFSVPVKITITPLLALFIGLYLAEGNTSKDKIFKFFREPTSGLVIGFTGSEASTIEVCIRAMEKIFLDEQGRIETWRIKIGTKYFSEAAAIGNKLGAVVLRRGEKGQGSASGLEIVEHVRDWSLEVIPVLQEVKGAFDHLEYTGAGIPRVDVFYNNTAAPYLFALMRDLIVEPELLENYQAETNE